MAMEVDKTFKSLPIYTVPAVMYAKLSDKIRPKLVPASCITVTHQ